MRFATSFLARKSGVSPEQVEKVLSVLETEGVKLAPLDRRERLCQVLARNIHKFNSQHAAMRALADAEGVSVQRIYKIINPRR